MPPATSKRNTIFISYSHADKERKWLSRAQTHLKQLELQGLVDRWDDTRIKAGQDWRKEIAQALESSSVAILLVSANFLASDFIHENELPPLLMAAEKRGTLIIPVIASACGFARLPELSKLQAINSPSNTLADMSLAKQDRLWDGVVERIQEFLSGRKKVSAQRTRTRKRILSVKAANEQQQGGGPPAHPESIPVVGQFFGRSEHLEKLHHFIADPSMRVAVIQGFYGIGKTTLVSKLVESASIKAGNIFWHTCSADKATPDVLLSALNLFFIKHRDLSLRYLWKDPNPAHLRLKLEKLIKALCKRTYFIVLDEFEKWLNAEFQVRNPQLAEVLLTMFSGNHNSKLILTSRKRPLFDPILSSVPLGSWFETTLNGLETSDAIKLLRMTGLNLKDELLERLALGYENNPKMLRIISHQIGKLYRDPEDLLKPGSAEFRLIDALAYAFLGLPSESRDALELLVICRLSLTSSQLRHLGIRFDRAVGPLINSFLVQFGEPTQHVMVSGIVRNEIFASLSPERKLELHKHLAELFAQARGAFRQNSMEGVQFALEEAFHRRESNDPSGARRAVVSVASHLIDLGYVDQAKENLEIAVAGSAEEALRAQAWVGLGRIADLTARYDDALAYFDKALTSYRKQANHEGTADVLYRIGRIHNARGNLCQAESFLRECIVTCEQYGVTTGWAGAELSLAWNHQQRGASDEVVLREFNRAVKRAEDTHDWKVLCAACWHVGFHLGGKMGDQKGAREAFAVAGGIATEKGLAKELGAIETGLAYLTTIWGDPEEGEIHARRAIELSKNLGNVYEMSNAYCNLGKALEAQCQWDEAEGAYAEGRRIASLISNFGGQVFADRGLARVYSKTGDFPKAVTLLQSALIRAQERDLPQAVTDLKEDLKVLQR